MNILLQILDEGQITDAQGRVVSFESTVIVMTSNCGSEQRSAPWASTSSRTRAGRVMQALGEFLRPEFLGRVDEVVVFSPLDEGDFARSPPSCWANSRSLGGKGHLPGLGGRGAASAGT